jgi:uncharacterized protein (TIRG00374 family)
VIKGEKGKVEYTFTASEIEGIQCREGLMSVLEKIDVALGCLAVLIYFSAISITPFRWWILLKASGLPQSPLRAYRLTFIGFFFNNVIPGQTGGDLVRAYYMARENSAQKTDAILTVFVDRMLGITALAIIGALIIPTDFEKYGASAVGIYGFIGVVVIASLVYFSKRLRRFFRLDKLLKKLPFQEFFQHVDRSIFIYRYRKAQLLICFLLSFAVHFTIILSFWVMGKSLGIYLPLASYMAFIPIIFIISSLPLTPAGWGVGEAAFMFFFGTANVQGAQAVALSLIFRMTMALISLLGGLFLLLEKERIRPGSFELDSINEEGA